MGIPSFRSGHARQRRAFCECDTDSVGQAAIQCSGKPLCAAWQEQQKREANPREDPLSGYDMSGCQACVCLSFMTLAGARQ